MKKSMKLTLLLVSVFVFFVFGAGIVYAVQHKTLDSSMSETRTDSVNSDIGLDPDMPTNLDPNQTTDIDQPTDSSTPDQETDADNPDTGLDPDLIPDPDMFPDLDLNLMTSTDVGELAPTDEQVALTDEQKIELYKEGYTFSEIDFSARLAARKSSKSVKDVGNLLKDRKSKMQRFQQYANQRTQSEQEEIHENDDSQNGQEEIHVNDDSQKGQEVEAHENDDSEK